MEKKDLIPLYITTTLPYVNAEPHLGHAMEFIRADAIARYKKLLGFDVFCCYYSNKFNFYLCERS